VFNLAAICRWIESVVSDAMPSIFRTNFKDPWGGNSWQIYNGECRRRIKPRCNKSAHTFVPCALLQSTTSGITASWVGFRVLEGSLKCTADYIYPADIRTLFVDAATWGGHSRHGFCFHNLLSLFVCPTRYRLQL
jgi:hypothetical protein